MCACVWLLVCHSSNVEVREQLEKLFFSSTIWVPGIELMSQTTKHLHLLSHVASPFLYPYPHIWTSPVPPVTAGLSLSFLRLAPLCAGTACFPLASWVAPLCAGTACIPLASRVAPLCAGTACIPLASRVAPLCAGTACFPLASWVAPLCAGTACIPLASRVAPLCVGTACFPLASRVAPLCAGTACIPLASLLPLVPHAPPSFTHGGF